MFVQGLSLHRQAMVTSLRTFTTAIYYYCVAVLYIYHHMQFTHIRHANPFLQYVFVVVGFCLSIYIELDDGVHIHNHTRGGGGWSWSSTQEEEGTEWHFPLARGKACDEMTGSLNFGVCVKSFGKLCLACDCDTLF